MVNKISPAKKTRAKAPAIGILLFLLATSLFAIAIKPVSDQNEIQRLTFTENEILSYPCLSDDGTILIYITETTLEEETFKAVRMKNIETGEEIELFRDSAQTALEPFTDSPLIVGSKPPVLSGNGSVAVFTLSLGTPANILDHYLAVVNTDGSNLRCMPLPIKALDSIDLKSHDFIYDSWERISLYSINSAGDRVACVVKGHLGPRRYGNPSAIVLIDLKNDVRTTVLGPAFIENEWTWADFPNRPLAGGGWAFGMSGNGEKIVFGANSSSDALDYDLYVLSWDEKEIQRITDFHDRWFSMADISYKGEKILFYYTGKAKQGIGAYVVSSDGSGLDYLKSQTGNRVEVYSMAENGTSVFFKHVYRGMLYDLEMKQERVIFDENTPGQINRTGPAPLDFPHFPSFWTPKVSSFQGDKIILTAPPRGKEHPEFYLLNLTTIKE